MSQKTYFILLGVLLVFAGFVAALALTPSIREPLRSLILGSERRVLGKVDGDLTGQGDRYTIIKVKTRDSIALEFYLQDPFLKTQTFQRRIVLNEKRDGYFNFRGNATNLVLTDIDLNNVLEVIAPTFDENLVPRLNVFRFDRELKDFTKIGPDSGQL